MEQFIEMMGGYAAIVAFQWLIGQPISWPHVGMAFVVVAAVAAVAK